MQRRIEGWVMLALAVAGLAVPASATPANRAGLGQRYGRFLAARLAACTTCHRSSPGAKAPSSLSEFPHNPFGARLAGVASALREQGTRTDIGRRLAAIAREDSDGDGFDNETELLLGHAPGDPTDRPAAAERKRLPPTRAAFAAFLLAYRWQPFESVVRPPVPGAGNPVDAFLDKERKRRGVIAAPEASRAILLRRVTLDLTGLVPTPQEMRAFLADPAPDAYERAVDRLLASPRYGERWARHFMDIWRYSDWAGWADGGQIRDSQPHIWRWRDWIVESLNAGKGYDRMVQEMLAADEIAPDDPDALRATGFLVRNFKLLSREQWLEDTVNHTSKAFLGVTMHCAKCHTHMYDPISQRDYYRFRAIFEPHQVRTDRVPGQLDTAKDGLVRAYDADLKAPTYLFVRGDERNPDKSRLVYPGVPESLGGGLAIQPVALPGAAVRPDRRPFVLQETMAASEAAQRDAEKAFETLRAEPESGERRRGASLALDLARARHGALTAVLAAERLEESGKGDTDEGRQAARQAAAAQREATRAEAARALWQAEQTLAAAKEPVARTTAEKAVEAARTAKEAAESAAKAPLSVAYTPRIKTYPPESTGRRRALARWLTDPQNPLTARVAVNHLWMRHFGQALVPSVADFGRNGRKPTHPELLDWLAAEFMARGWRLKPLHRLLVTSRAYRMDSRLSADTAKKDPDNLWLGRMNARRMEAEAVRDNVLFVAGSLDEGRGGPEIDHQQGLTSRRRSLYLRSAAEKQAEFLQIFDGPSVAECYERRQTVLPQQALALANSELTRREARALSQQIVAALPQPLSTTAFIETAFRRILSRPPSPEETRLCRAYLQKSGGAPARVAAAEAAALPNPLLRRCENLALVLFNHHDFVTIR